MIQGYPDRSSVLAGEDLRLHVSTDAARFRVELWRLGRATELVLTTEWFDGVHAPPRTPDVDWRWPAYTVALPGGAAPGAYAAVLVEEGTEGRSRIASTPGGTMDGPGWVLVAVRSEQPGSPPPILYKLPLFTYHQYNAAGGPTWYRGGRRTVSLHRPGGGLGGTSNYPGWRGYDDDPFDPASRRQTFPHWDHRFLAWLEENGLAVDVCTDLDLHLDRALLAPYRLLVSAGHDEYWTQEMRDAVTAFVRSGGNAAFFGGNTCFRKVTLDDAAGSGLLTVVDDWWRLGQPENTLTGVGYRGGGGHWWPDARPSQGYAVQHARHWVFAGIDSLRDGTSVIGGGHHLIGYEADGAHVRRSAAGRLEPAGDDGTPPDFVVLGVAELAPARPAHLGPGPWWAFEPRETPEGGVATMGLRSDPGGGMVFTASTTDWPRVMQVDDAVAAVTRNVLDRLSVRGVRVEAVPSRRLPVPVFAEGDVAVFEVVLPAALAGRALTYLWTCSCSESAGVEKPPGSGGGSRAARTAPSLRLELPAGTEPVTVTVDVLDDEERVAFGSATVLPETASHALEIELVHAVREAETVIQVSRTGAGTGDPPPPILSLPRDTALAALGRTALEQLTATLRRAASIAAQLADAAAPAPGPDAAASPGAGRGGREDARREGRLRR